MITKLKDFTNKKMEITRVELNFSLNLGHV